MDAATHTTILYIALFMLGALGFGLGPILIVKLLSPSSHTRQSAGKSSQLIECGMVPIGKAWIRFGIVYYLYALIFLAFDVDVLFLFPVALAYNDPSFAYEDFIEILLFVAILALAVVYAWCKGVFTWTGKPSRHP
ncbi:MAG: NADH-quinone oxidoreductase subunit A [Desulfobulbaceae bacterium]|nr:NADH-quinone oxidoreductase subunit A [Desulfobulbaceae bacterium]